MKVLDAFNSLDPGVQKQITNFLLWGSVASIVVGAILVLVGAVAGIAAALVVGGEALGLFVAILVGASIPIAAFATAIVLMWQKSQGLRNGVRDLGVAFSSLLQTIQEVAGPIVETIQNTFGDKIIEGIRKAGDILGGFFSAIAGIIQGYLIPALQSAKEFWDANRATIEPLLGILGQVVKFFIMVGAAILGFIALIGVGGVVAAVYMAIAAFQFFINSVKAAIAIVRAIIGAIGDLINWVGNAIQSFSNFGTQVRTIVGAIPGMIRGFFSGAASWLYAAGRDIIQGLINGIKSAVGAVKDALNAVTSMIPDWKGPKAKDLKLLRPTGRFLMQGLTYGIKDGLHEVKSALSDVTNQIGGVDRSGRSPTGVTHSKTVNQTVNVTTQEIDPRFHAAQLGWELLAVTP
jgi:phage-related protein